MLINSVFSGQAQFAIFKFMRASFKFLLHIKLSWFASCIIQEAGQSKFFLPYKAKFCMLKKLKKNLL